MQMLRSGKAVPAICQAADISEEGRALLGGDVPARQFLEQLLEQEHYADAIAFLAHALPRREAVWWAWLCAREVAGEKPPPATVASLDATKAWIAEPTDANRRTAFAAAEAAGIASPAGCAGLAAFMSGETLGPPGAPPAPPEEYAASKAIGGSINLAAVADATIDIPARYAEFVRRGLELADRVQLWSAEADAKTAR